MAHERVARRYARAVFDIAVARNDLDGWLRDLRAIREALGQPDIVRLLENPGVAQADKRRVVAQLLGGMDRLRINFVNVLVDNGRIEALPAIVTAFEQLYNEHKDIAIAKVTTAVPLDASEAQRVQARLQELTGKQIILQHEVDPSILGGIIAQIGDRVINGSLAWRLDALRAELAR